MGRGLLSGALAAVSLGMFGSAYVQPPPKPEPAPPTGSRSNSRRGFYINTPSGQLGSRDRLTIDRSSSIGKIDRWVRNGTMELTQPDQRSLMRHGWYRRQKEKEARAAATEAWQQAAQ